MNTATIEQLESNANLTMIHTCKPVEHLLEQGPFTNKMTEVILNPGDNRAENVDHILSILNAVFESANSDLSSVPRDTLTSLLRDAKNNGAPVRAGLCRAQDDANLDNHMCYLTIGIGHYRDMRCMLSGTELSVMAIIGFTTPK